MVVCAVHLASMLLGSGSWRLVADLGEEEKEKNDKVSIISPVFHVVEDPPETIFLKKLYLTLSVCSSLYLSTGL